MALNDNLLIQKALESQPSEPLHNPVTLNKADGSSVTMPSDLALIQVTVENQRILRQIAALLEALLVQVSEPLPLPAEDVVGSEGE